MKLEQIEEILRRKFADPADREYWEEKYREAVRKAKNAKENEIDFRKMRVYDR